MSELTIRVARKNDLPRLTAIYNHYVRHTAITFDIEPYSIESRTKWFEQFAETGRHRLLVAERNREVLGYAGTTYFRPKAAYNTTVETTIYCLPEATGQGIGRRLYSALFAALTHEDVRLIVAGFTLPNLASAKLHERLGFQTVGTFTEVGRKFGRYWDVCWTQRPLHLDGQR